MSPEAVSALLLTNPYTPEATAFWSLLALAVGFLSGLLGIGGGLQMVPGLVFLAPYVLGEPLVSAKAATGIAAVQALASSFSSTLVHLKNGVMKRRLVLLFGIPAILGGYVGSFFSAFWNPDIILGILAFALAITLFLGIRKYIKTLRSISEPETFISEWNVLKAKWLWILPFSTLIGGLAGIIGMGGAVFYVPFMTEIVGLPVRQAIITGTGIVILTSLGSVLGKAQAGIVPWELSLYISAIAFLGGWLGARVQARVQNTHLRVLHLALVFWAVVEAFRKLMFT
jgi:uncharacterized protein